MVVLYDIQENGRVFLLWLQVLSSEFEGDISHIQNVLSTDGGSSRQESEIQLLDSHQTLRQQGHQGEEIIIEKPQEKGSEAEDVVTQLSGALQQVEASEKPQEEDEKQTSKELVSGSITWCSVFIKCLE